MPGRLPSRVLVVEDEPLIAMLLQEWLEELHYDTIGPAASVAAALDLLHESPPDCALLDVSLPDGNCFAVADELAERGIPFLFVTGVDPDDVPSRFATRPLVGKPYQHARLREMVSSLLACTTGESG